MPVPRSFTVFRFALLIDRSHIFQATCFLGLVMTPMGIGLASDTNGPPTPGTGEETVIKRVPKLEMYPCDDCHSTPADFNEEKRSLEEEHPEKKLHFAAKDGVEERWCHNCHQEGNYKRLKLQSGRVISFNETYFICGECHGDILNKWNKNAHGKRIGNWNGAREVYSCPECHDPHDPHFKSMESKPPPAPPVNTFWGL